MATPSLKQQQRQQQLHNFPVSLKWGQTSSTTVNHHDHSNKASSPPTDSNRHQQKQQQPSRIPPPRGSRSARQQRISFTSCSTFLPRPPRTEPSKETTTSTGGVEEPEDRSSRPWNLRRRNGGEMKDVSQRKTEMAKSIRVKGVGVSGGGNGVTGGGGGGADGGLDVMAKKRKLWIALSSDEIEEDIFAFTGSKPARRPRKYPKSIQKSMDRVFPGLWLVGISAYSYKMREAAMTRNV